MNRYYRRLMARGIIPAGIGLRSDEGHPSGAPSDAGDPPAPEGAPAPSADEAPKVDEIDWKAEARKHEKRAKENAKAAEELAKFKASQMSDQEKAVAAAKAEGASEALKTVGVKLAAAELKAAAKDKGLNVADITDLIRVEQFVDENGDVNEKAIKAAVDKLAKIAPAASAKSGAPLPGGSGGRTTTNATLDSAVAARYGT